MATDVAVFLLGFATMVAVVALPWLVARSGGPRA